MALFPFAEGGFPADGRAYLSLFGLRGEWTALLDGRELARGDDTEAEIRAARGRAGSHADDRVRRARRRAPLAARRP